VPSQAEAARAALEVTEQAVRPRVGCHHAKEAVLIFITARFRVLPEHADAWPELSRGFTEATRAEPGCLWFDWSRSLDDPDEYVLVEAFRDGDAGAAHVQSDHFANARKELPRYLAETPRIVNATLEQDDWSLLGEMEVAPRG
jgi:quinol monooxygenase YgiN